MKMIRFMLATLAVALFSMAAAAQTSPLAPQQAKPPAVLPKGKIACVNTTIFQEKVAEFRSRIDALNRQFEGRVKEVQTLADKITALENTLKSQSAVLTPARVAEQTEQLEAMKKEYQRKAEDLQADAGRARDKAFQPISAKLGKFAEDYTAKHGIVLLVDVANAVQSGTLLWVDPRVDVTQDFINEYNKANPAPAAPAAPPPAKPGQE
jgi:Skp family chaperone for outer membrane proteins